MCGPCNCKQPEKAWTNVKYIVETSENLTLKDRPGGSPAAYGQEFLDFSFLVKRGG